MTTNNTYTPYRSMRAALMNLRNFRGSSVSAVLNNNIYTVKSYQTVMLSLDTQTGTVLFNNRYYSHTTSKIQNLIKAAFNLYNCKERAVFRVQHGDIKATYETLKEAAEA